MENVFAERITQVRREKGLSQRAAAALIGIQAASLSSYESGRKSPNLEMALKIATAYDRSLDWLCGIVKEDKKNEDSPTRADAFNAFTTLCEYPIGVHVSTDWELDSSGVEFSAVNIRIAGERWLFNLIDTYKKLLDVYQSGAIPYEALTAWKEKKAKELEHYRLDGAYVLCDDEELPF